MKIEGYKLEKDNMYENKGNSRSIMYVSKNLRHIRGREFEGKKDASIVIKVVLPNKTLFYIWCI